jgi:hypothetical protein
MLTMIAQAEVAPTTSSVFRVMMDVFSRPDTLARPLDLTSHLQALSFVWAVIFLAAGLACLLNGYKLYKPITITMGLLLGLAAGYYLGKQIQAAHIVAGCLGVLFAVGCWPLMKYAVAMFGGLAGAFIGANLWVGGARLLDQADGTSALANHYWIGAVMGLLMFGLLAFVVFKASVVLFTSVSGSTLAVFGTVALLLQVPQWQKPVVQSLSAHPIIFPLVILVPAAIGLILQQAKPAAAPAAPAKEAKDAKPAAA